MRVVDHDASRRAGEVTQGFGEKDLAIETLECRITLEEQHARIAQHRRGGLYFPLLATEFDVVRGGVVLHLLTWRKVVLTGRHRRRLSDSMPAAECRQRLIRHLRA